MGKLEYWAIAAIALVLIALAAGPSLNAAPDDVAFCGSIGFLDAQAMATSAAAKATLDEAFKRCDGYVTADPATPQ